MKIKELAIIEKICPFEVTVNNISGKFRLFEESMKERSLQGEMLREIVSVDRRVLNQQLKELEGNRILSKELYEFPPRIEYMLTLLVKYWW